MTRDNDIHVIDSRQMTSKVKLSDPNFKVVADYSRCAFSVSFDQVFGVIICSHAVD